MSRRLLLSLPSTILNRAVVSYLPLGLRWPKYSWGLWEGKGVTRLGGVGGLGSAVGSAGGLGWATLDPVLFPEQSPDGSYYRPLAPLSLLPALTPLERYREPGPGRLIILANTDPGSHRHGHCISVGLSCGTGSQPRHGGQAKEAAGDRSSLCANPPERA